MPVERLRGLLVFLLIGIVILYVIYRFNNKFSKEDIPFKATAEINLVGLLVMLALFLIFILSRN